MPSNDDVLIRVEGVSKRFCRDLKRSLWYGVEDTVADCVRLKGNNPKLRRDEFWAVNDVSFDLKRGECLGLIGHNGAGKTTLLKMLNGLIKPDKGRIEMRGRVGALIALGAGFNPILTGRENIYINGSVLGLSKREIDAKIDEIIEFAEIGEFIDAPVQTYSSGMGVRLGFAVATTMEPDILLLDEVLAVGDAAFRYKCFRRVAHLRQQAAVIFVSHNVEHIAQICDAGLVLQRGQPAFLGTATNAISAYASLSTNDATVDSADRFLVVDPRLLAADFKVPPSAVHGSAFPVAIRMHSRERIPEMLVRLSFTDASGSIVAECFSHAPAICNSVAIDLRFNIPQLHLKGGRYLLSISITDDRGSHLIWSYKQHLLNVEGPALGTCPYSLPIELTTLPAAPGRNAIGLAK